MANDELITAEAQELAEQEDVDWTRIQGSGKDGRVLKGDVEDYLTARSLWDEYVEVGNWKGVTKYTCTLDGYPTTSEQRMREHLNALESRGAIPQQEEEEDNAE